MTTINRAFPSELMFTAIDDALLAGVENANHTRESERQAQRASEEAAQAANEHNIAQLHSAADTQFHAAIAQGVGQMASSALNFTATAVGNANQQGSGKGGGGATSSSPGVQGGGQGAAAGAASPDPGFKAAGEGAAAIGNVVGAYFTSEASHKRADAERAAADAQRAHSTAAEHREDGSQAGQLHDRTVDLMRSIMEAQRAAEQAALRG